MGERGSYVPGGGGRGASLRDRRRVAAAGGRQAETPAQRRERLRRLRGKS